MTDHATLYASATIARDTLTKGSFRGALYPLGEHLPGPVHWVCTHKHRTEHAAVACSARELRRRTLVGADPMKPSP